MNDARTIIDDAEETHFCQVHPDREASLRCIRCNRYMCTDCAVRTPVGYICRECQRKHEDRFFNATTRDYVIVFAIMAVIGAVVGGLILLVGLWWLISLLIGLAIGGAIGTVGRRVSGGRIGRYSGEVAVAGLAIGALLAPTIFILLRSGILVINLGLLINVNVILFLAGAAGAVYGTFKRRI
jgi:hypothetical protein